ncbi:MAG: AraC family transcriptional regulator ligand-binding domain-containing protein [Novosphingobium sp.]|nr:AraC family transcriptional regulator ligand-binding domain-containing protein [Novosphingobium sp.]
MGRSSKAAIAGPAWDSNETAPVSRQRSSAHDGLADLACAGENHVTLAKLLSNYQEVVRELGGNPELLLEQAGIEPTLLAQPSAKVPVRALGQLLEDTAARLGCSDLGLRLAERQSMHAAMEPLDRLFCTAPTIRDAFECCMRHIGAFNSGLIMELDDHFEGECGFLHFQLLDGLALFPQLIEQLMLLTHDSVVFLSAGFARSRTVWFSHLNISPPIVYARRFNTVVKFGQEYDGLFFDERDLSTKVADCDAESFAREARIIAERYPALHKDIDIKVRQAVFRTLTSSEHCTRRNIAGLLRIQERTLNRQLSRKGTSFETIRDEVRRNLAFRYLAREDLSLTEIAGRLGYSELAVLSRSCRRWFGAPPRQLRQDILSTHVGSSILRKRRNDAKTRLTA